MTADSAYTLRPHIVFRSLPFTEPSPRAYPIENGLYGAVVAYPNLWEPEDIADELEMARRWGIRPIVLTEEGGEDVARRLADEFAGQVGLYGVTGDGRMFVIPVAVGGMPTTHTMAVEGQDVIAAGHVWFDASGRVYKWDHMSGHYRPHERQAWEVAQAVFRLAGLVGPGP